MIKTLQKKMISVTMIATATVLSVLIAIINIANYSSIMSDSDRILQILADNNGAFPQSQEQMQPAEQIPPDSKAAPKSTNEPAKNMRSPEEPFETRFFTVTFSSSGVIENSDTQKIAAVDTAQAKSLAKKIYSSKKTSGFTNDYRYKVIESDEKTMIIFVDCTKSLSNFYSFLWSSIGVSAAGLLLVLLLVVLISKKAVAPIAQSYEKQKRFITDAGHEIKTPLTIIDANAEVVEMTNGESEWTQSIRNQVARLTSLTNQLVSLSRMEESTNNTTLENFNLSQTIEESAQPFFAVAQAAKKDIVLDIEPDITLCGDKKLIDQLVNLMLDNALKYSSNNAKIEISLKNKGKKKELIFKNPVDEISVGNLDMLFERFYRYDTSRNSKTGGSGIGLSVVKAIVQKHSGKISAKSDDGKSIVFTATFK